MYYIIFIILYFIMLYYFLLYIILLYYIDIDVFYIILYIYIYTYSYEHTICTYHISAKTPISLIINHNILFLQVPLGEHDPSLPCLLMLCVYQEFRCVILFELVEIYDQTSEREGGHPDSTSMKLVNRLKVVSESELPSGKLTVCYWESPCLIGKATINNHFQ